MAKIHEMTRFVACGTCGQKQMVKDLLNNPRGPHCVACNDSLCAFCGCTEASPCFHEDFPREAGFTCSWYQPGMCDFCHWQLAEADYYITIGEPQNISQIKHKENAIVLV